jgi:hypothetical protein
MIYLIMFFIRLFLTWCPEAASSRCINHLNRTKKNSFTMQKNKLPVPFGNCYYTPGLSAAQDMLISPANQVP